MPCAASRSSDSRTPMARSVLAVGPDDGGQARDEGDEDDRKARDVEHLRPVIGRSPGGLRVE